MPLVSLSKIMQCCVSVNSNKIKDINRELLLASVFETDVKQKLYMKACTMHIRTVELLQMFPQIAPFQTAMHNAW